VLAPGAAGPLDEVPGLPPGYLVRAELDGVRAAFGVTGPRGRVLYTTRDPLVLAAVHAAAEHVGVLSAAAARQLLARSADVADDALPQP